MDWLLLNVSLLPWQWLILVICAICIGLSKTGINGIITIGISLLAIIFGAKESTGIILPMLCFADVIAVIYYRGSVEWRYILYLLPWALAGFALALLVDSLVPAQYFKVLIGICIFIGLLVMFWNDRQNRKAAHSAAKGTPPETNDAANDTWQTTFSLFLKQMIFGAIGGFSTMIGNAAAPIMSIYLLSMRLPKISFVGTAAWFFLIVNFLKIPPQIFAWHNITLAGLKLGLLMTPFIILGTVLGVILVKKISEAHFRILIYAITLLSTVLLFL